MKRYKLALATIAVILFSLPLAGCQGGVPQNLYDQVTAQLRDAQAQVAGLQGETRDLQAQKEAVDAELKAVQAQIAGLQGQVSGLKEQYVLAGATPAETAGNIVRYYHETHVYSAYDLFVCSDMAADVWNMLKAQGISAVMAVGDIDTAIGDIVLSDHAWVLAEVSPGDYLALETTGGFVITRSQNALYYRGWSFASPKELKSYNQLVREYNVRVDIRNQIADEANRVSEEHSQATSQSTADKLKAVYDELVELVRAREAELNDIKSEIDGLATRL